jgi:hypothetical protein
VKGKIRVRIGEEEREACKQASLGYGIMILVSEELGRQQPPVIFEFVQIVSSARDRCPPIGWTVRTLRRPSGRIPSPHIKS